MKIGVRHRRKIIVASVFMSIALLLAGHAAFQLQKGEIAIPPAQAPQNARNLAPSDPPFIPRD